MKKLISSTLVALTLSAGSVFAAGGAGYVKDFDFSFEGPFGSYDPNQLQRGLKVYTEVCSACHGLKYVPLRALHEDGVGYSMDQVRAYAAEYYEVYDADLEDFRPAKPADHFPANDAVGAPDLSLMAKSRAGFHGPYGLGINQFFKGMGGPEYIASLLAGYTGETKEQAGAIFYENTAFPGGWISMAPPLEDGLVDFDDGHANDLYHMSEDLAAFLMWTAEPKLAARKQTGFIAVLLLSMLAGLLYMVNKRLWAPIKGKDH
ncbi:MAG: cytochrome c1 [Paracoccaceae bacterium]|jgi:ubiquinol-cytochrome c reductase cytochrome c1 subunit